MAGSWLCRLAQLMSERAQLSLFLFIFMFLFFLKDFSGFFLPSLSLSLPPSLMVIEEQQELVFFEICFDFALQQKGAGVGEAVAC